MDVSYDWYKIFNCVAESGNITAASERLYISQPAVSQCIKQLEHTLGCKLFIRSTKGVMLTAEGSLLHHYVNAGIRQFQTGEKLLSSLVNLESGEIHVGASDMTLEFFLLPYLESFNRLYPKIKICVTNGPTPETIRLLSEGEIDFGIISEPFVADGFEAFPVRLIEDIFICGSENFDYFNKEKSIASLADFPLILLEKNTSTRTYIDNFFGDNHFSKLPDFELATSSLIVQFVKRNLGIGCVVRDFATGDIQAGNIREIQFAEKIRPRNLCLIKKQSILSTAASRLIDMCIE